MGRQNYSAVLGALSVKLHGCSSFTQEISLRSRTQPSPGTNPHSPGHLVRCWEAEQQRDAEPQPQGAHSRAEHSAGCSCGEGETCVRAPRQVPAGAQHVQLPAEALCLQDGYLEA